MEIGFTSIQKAGVMQGDFYVELLRSVGFFPLFFSLLQLTAQHNFAISLPLPLSSDFQVFFNRSAATRGRREKDPDSLQSSDFMRACFTKSASD